MGRVFIIEIEGRSYRCKCCTIPLALAHDIISRNFSCSRGKAYLFNTAVNVTVGAQEERMMISGLHTVSDIFCCNCGQILGWKYVIAHDKLQKYKEGKIVLERGRVARAGEGVNDLNLESSPSLSDTEDA
ncbi:protein yippee-like At5g53940 [Impatiens glandulifera]|uniref:protein yippee-like At5g53940 n=1 Tax=Impatiens glandulifera TaxID=253017 RepID=UPI001FB09630|nr:protein yippee-like At5g53940 [Impatiens glandulifera]